MWRGELLRAACIRIFSRQHRDKGGRLRHNAGQGRPIAPPEQSNTHSIFSWRDYGNRVGIWRLFELFDELEIPAEAQMNTAIYEHCPDIPQMRARR